MERVIRRGSRFNRKAAAARVGRWAMSERIGQPVRLIFDRCADGTCDSVCSNWQHRYRAWRSRYWFALPGITSGLMIAVGIFFSAAVFTATPAA